MIDQVQGSGAVTSTPRPDLVLVRALRPMRADDIPRSRGEEFFFERRSAFRLAQLETPLVEIITVSGRPLDWRNPRGRMLRATANPAPHPWRVVACVNIWNDAPALERTAPSWIHHVDRVIVLDGPYHCPADDLSPHSTDQLVTVLANLHAASGTPIDFEIAPGEGTWPDQPTKRGRFFELAQEGDLLFIVDADEAVEDGAALRRVPWCDVGWVAMRNPIYERGYAQPRLIRWQPGLSYRGRHHWIYAGDQLLTSHQYGGLALHVTTDLSMQNERGLGQTPARAKLKRRILRAQRRIEEPRTVGNHTERSDRSLAGRESLQIMQLTHYDPGLVAYRLHTAINATTPNASVLASAGGPDRNPFGALRQYDSERDRSTLVGGMATADVLHLHLDYSILRALESLGAERPRALVMHHHGSIYRKMSAQFNRLDRESGALRLISNLELTKYGIDLHWLPNPVPVVEYRQLRARHASPMDGRPLRVAHSPSKRELKGTEAFLAACDTLRAKGVRVEPVLIEKMQHGEALALKASCDACFDSFWLGIQCSGVEAGAMGMPVIAGDPYVAAQYQARIGSVPYIYADDQAGIEAALEQLATNPIYYEETAMAVSRYVEAFHDEAVVALAYLDLLDRAFDWRLGRAATPSTRLAPTQWGIVPELHGR